MSEKERIYFLNWAIEVQRKAFRRTLSIHLYPQKPIKVLAPKTTSHKVIQDFLLARKDWIEKNLKKFEELRAQIPQKKFVASEEFLFLGRSYKLKPVITLNKKGFVSKTETEILLHIPRNEWSAEVLFNEQPQALNLLRSFYEREARRYLTQRIHKLSAETQLKFKKLSFREQRTRWGSCSSSGNISLNWRMIVFKPELIDYILLHELCHLKHLNHSAHFWSLVESFMPNYMEQEKELKKAHFQIEFLNPNAEIK
ncbi:MAG: M48 family metallopeptidase [Bdellovibrionia bacterium]